MAAEAEKPSRGRADQEKTSLRTLMLLTRNELNSAGTSGMEGARRLFQENEFQKASSVTGKKKKKLRDH